MRLHTYEALPSGFVITMRNDHSVIPAASLIGALVVFGACASDETRQPPVEIDIQALENGWASVGVDISDLRWSPDLEAAVRSWIDMEGRGSEQTDPP